MVGIAPRTTPGACLGAVLAAVLALGGASGAGADERGGPRHGPPHPPPLGSAPGHPGRSSVSVFPTGPQGAPPGPAAPPAPAAPSSPRTPAAPAGAPVRDLTLALLSLNAREGSVDTLALRLGGSLLALTGETRDPRPLATVLGEALYGRDLAPDLAAGIATGLARALGTGPDARQLERALGEVREALGRAGLGAPAILLIDTELRRFAGTAR